MAKGRYRVKGTKDFMVGAVFCAFLCLWSIRDAWFPSKKVLEKHPQQVEVSMKVSGVLKSLPLKAGDEVGGSMILAEVYDEFYRAEVAAAEAAFEAAKNSRDPAIEERLDVLLAAREELAACVLRNDDIIRTTSHGEGALHGVFLEYVTEPATRVEAGETILLVEPADTFYLFNKTLAILSFFGAIAMLIFHRMASH